MKLNADILFENLKKRFPAEITGYRSEELTLHRPEFYLEGSGTFQKDHLYIIPGGEFPRHPGMEKGCVLLCSCTVPNLSYYRELCCIIRLTGHPDPFAAANAVTAIYDRYSRWDHQLQQLLETNPDPTEMTALTSRLFENPILVLDADLRFVATAGYEGLEDQAEAFDGTGSDRLSAAALNEFLNSMDMQTENRSPMLLSISGHSVLSINIYDLDSYAGSITLEYRNLPHCAGDESLLRHFSEYLVLALHKYSAYMTSERGVLRKVVSALLNERPVDAESRRRAESMPKKDHWICVALHPDARLSKVPASYICRQMEQQFTGCMAFSYQTNIAGFFAGDGMPKDPDFRNFLEDRLKDVAGATATKAGISSDFSDLFSARLYYLQAVAALEDGCILHPEEQYYYFRDYALTELIINAQSDMPLEMYYADGLRKLFEHDANSSTSYVETLRVYLNNERNITATAAELHIHRSTFLERLSRIRRELWEDLDDPDIRLRMQIILKALEIQDRASSALQE